MMALQSTLMHVTVVELFLDQTVVEVPKIKDYKNHKNRFLGATKKHTVCTPIYIPEGPPAGVLNTKYPGF